MEKTIRGTNFHNDVDTNHVRLFFGTDHIIEIGRSDQPGFEDCYYVVRSEYLPEPDGRQVRRTCPPVRDIDQVIEIFSSYYKQDGKYETLVEWESGQ